MVDEMKQGVRNMKSNFFEKYTLIQREDILMKEIIDVLQIFGGKATKRQIIEKIIEVSDVIDEEFFEFSRISKKSGAEYYPWKWNVNFAIKHLKNAGYIVGNYREFELTGKGLSTNGDVVDISEIRSVSESMKSKQIDENHTENQEDSVLEEDTPIVVLEWRNKLSQALQKMHPRRFEMFARRLIKEMGVDIDDTLGITYVGDGGIDGFGYVQGDDFRTTRVAIQAKRYDKSHKISSSDIDRFRGAMDKFNAEFGIFITTSTFTKDAIKASRIGTRVITLINGEDIIDLVEKYQLYIKPVTTYELEDFYFMEEN